jgi:2-C-methyl-D-erythritol 4-phosphate cytidylyltransferase
MNICILLAAGTSSRFGSSKQLFILSSGKTILETCLETLVQVVDKVIVVTNEVFLNKNRKVIVVTNSINCRLKSIEAGLHYIDTHYSLSTRRVVIHDVARPFITSEQVSKILHSKKKLVQYCLKLTNGLIYKGTQCVSRDDYMELCTPLCIEYKTCRLLCKNKVPYEFISGLAQEEYQLIPSSYKYLRKITTIDDIYI